MLVRVDEKLERSYRWDETAAFVARRPRERGPTTAPAVPLLRTEYAGYKGEMGALRYEHSATHYSEACAGSSPVFSDASGTHWLRKPGKIEAFLVRFFQLFKGSDS
jgi:hypothetical protein